MPPSLLSLPTPTQSPKKILNKLLLSPTRNKRRSLSRRSAGRSTVLPGPMESTKTIPNLAGLRRPTQQQALSPTRTIPEPPSPTGPATQATLLADARISSSSPLSLKPLKLTTKPKNLETDPMQKLLMLPMQRKMEALTSPSEPLLPLQLQLSHSERFKSITKR